MTDELGLRERKKRETRLAISRAAITLGMRLGWSNVTVDAIAEAADVSPRTFRNYFASKAEAIAASHLERMLDIADGLRARPAEEPLWEAITAVLLAAHGAEDQDAPPPNEQLMAPLRMVLSEAELAAELARANDTAQAALVEVVAERTGIDPRRAVYPKLVAAAIGNAVSVGLGHWVLADPPLALGAVMRDVLAQIRAGLPQPTKGEQQ